MASDITVLYHDEVNTKWIKLLNRGVNSSYDSGADVSSSNKPYAYNGSSPVLTCSITDSLGIPMEMELQLNNRQGSPTMAFTEPVEGEIFIDDPLVNNQIGQFSGLLKELTFLYVYETRTYMPLFQGRIHLLEEKIQGFHGSNMLLTCRDALEDLTQGKLTHLSRDNTTLTGRLNRNELVMTTTAGDDGSAFSGSGDDANIYKVGKRAYIVKDLIDKAVYAGGTATAALLADDVNKFKSGDSKTFVTEELVDNNRWKYSEHTNGSPLSLLQKIAKSDNYVVSGKTHYGFGFYADITRLSSLRSVGRRAQDLAYFRAGYEPTSTPETFGLTAALAANAPINESGTSSTSLFPTKTTIQKRNMFANFDFGELSNEIWTHVALKHKGKADAFSEQTFYMSDIDQGQTDDSSTTNALSKEKQEETVVRTDLFTILYLDNVGENVGSHGFTGTAFSYARDSRGRSFKTVSSLHNHVSLRNYSGGSKTYLGNVQFCSGTGDNQFIILSNPQEDTLEALQASVEAGNAPIIFENRKDSANAVSATVIEYPSAKHRMRKVKDLETLDGFNNNYQALREMLAGVLGGGNKQGNALKKGVFSLGDWPSVKWVNTAQSGSSVSTLVPAGLGGGGNLTPMSYGIKRGAVVTTRNAGYTYVGNISAAASANVSVSMYREDKLDLSDTDIVAGGFRKSWSVGDSYEIYVPTRVGHVIRVTNKLVNVNGDHLVTKISYSFSMGHVETIIETQAINNDFNFATGYSLGEKKGLEGFDVNGDGPTLDQNLSILITASKAYQATGILWWHSNAFGATPALAAANKRDYNTFSWSGGQIVTHVDKEPFIINPGDTDAALTTAGYTSPMEANIQYVIYLDRSRPPVDGKYNFEIDQVTHDDNGYVRLNHFLEVAYLTIGKNAKAGSKTIGIPGSSFYSVTIDFPNGHPNVEFLHTFDNVFGTNKIMVESDRLINNEGLTSALMKKGAGRPWSSNLSLRGTAYNAVVWDNGSSSNGTLTFGNGDTVTLVAGTATSLAAGTHYLYIDGTSAGLTGNLTPTTTTTHSTATGDDKLLLALITVGLSSEGSSPVIMPFNSKTLTINATAITANAILATHVQTGTLGVDKLTSAAQGDITEKTRTHVGGSAPSWTPRTYDIWFDTDPQPTVIKVWDGDSWEVRNSNAPEGGGMTTFTSLLANVPTTANSGSPSNTPDVAVKQYDLWLTTDTHQLFIALHATNNDSISSGEWTLKSDADAINYAATEINGGLIKTQRIKLLAGGSLNIAGAGNAFDTTVTSVTSTLRLIDDSGGISTSDTTVGIDAYASGDLYIYAGDVIQIDSEAMYVESGSDTSLTVKRAWLATTAATHSDNALISKYNYSVIAQTDPHIILDNAGITGYSDAFSPEFSISSITGKAEFADGTAILDCNGITLGATSSGTKAFQAKLNSWASNDEKYFFLYSSNSADGVYIGGDGTNNLPLYSGCDLLPSSSLGLQNLGKSGFPWNQLYAKTLAGDCISDSSSNGVSTVAVSREALYNHEQTTHGGGGSTDGVVNSASWNTSTGVLTLGRSNSLSSITVDLDGRYSTSDTNTTYTAGTFLDLSGTTFNVDLTEITESSSSSSADLLICITDGGSVLKIEPEDIEVNRFKHTTSTYMAYGDTSHGTHGGGSGLSYWEESGTTFRPKGANPSNGTAAYHLGDNNYGLGWIYLDNAYGFKTNYNNVATTIWETHGHHEFESDVYMKDKLTTEQELVVQNKLELRQGLSSAGNMSLHFTGDTDTGLYRSSIDQMHFSVGGYTGIMIDDSSGAISVGIAGIYNSSYALNVNGETRKTSGGGYWDSYSDDRIKTDVASLSGGMATIAALNPVSYKFTDVWKEAVSSKQHTTQYGFLASEYKTVFPNYITTGTDDLVKVDGKWQIANIPDDEETKPNRLDNAVIEEKIENIMSINEAAIVPHLVAAIKELEARISVLEGN